MRVKRLKKANRILIFYRYHYNIMPPYSILLDGTFCQAALQYKINLREQIPKYLATEVNLMTTKCVLHELEELGSQLHGALVVAKNYSIAKCPHKVMKTAAQCLKHLAKRSKTKNRIKYFVATQDNNLLQILREVGGIPTLSIRYNTILLEKPSEESLKATEKEQTDLKKVKELKLKILGAETTKKPKKRPKNPNPLSCKKKKRKIDSTANLKLQTKNSSIEKKRVRKRKRKNVPNDKNVEKLTT